MCGVAGAVLADGRRARAAVEAMCDAMVARGPDDAGVELLGHGRAAVALGARRLAVIDRSRRGHQPMHDADRGTTLVFNGHISNFRELRRELEREGERFASSGDTEIVLRAYGRWGVRCVERFLGMFAFAIWDAPRRRLVLGRDALGVKPLYYRHDGDCFSFASQVKAILAGGLAAPRLSRVAVESYLAFGAVDEPLTAIEGVRALPAGHTATLCDGRLVLERYWQPPEAADGTSPAAADELRELLAATVADHLVSDAPLGVFLSGGLDSSALAALAARAGGDVRTVSVGFEEEDFSETAYARLVAERLGTRHTEVVLRPDDLLDSLDGAFAAMDQPSMDGLNTYAVSRAARASGLTVAVSGLGGDELFDGYGYAGRIRRLERLRRLPAPVRRPGALALAGRRPKAAAWLAGGIEAGASYEMLRRVALPRDVERLLVEPGSYRAGRRLPADGSAARHAALADLTGYTRNVLLRDTDAMSMAHSLEVRVPFLDRRVVDGVLRLPTEVRARRPKALLAAAVRDLLPREVLARPKRGFVVPLAAWMRGPLRAEVDATMASPSAALAEVVDWPAAQATWRRYREDGGRWTPPWSLFALARWAATLEVPR